MHEQRGGEVDRSRALAVLQREAGQILALADDAGIDADRPVPSCPGWTLDDIPRHLGRVYAMVATVLDGRPDQPPDRAKIPSRPDAQAPAEWMRERLGILIPLLRDIPADSRRWNFATGPDSPVAFWWRRQMHETLIHRVDTELAAGQPLTAAEPQIAADGVGDLLLIAGFRPVGVDELGGGPTVHLHATDAGADAEWTVDAASRTYTRAHLKADAAVRGPAWDLDRWCWRRDSPENPPDGLELIGDRQAARDWRPTI